jgi:hypothetical protein
MTGFKFLRFLPILALAVFSISSCSGPKNGVCTIGCGGGGGGSADLTFTLVADTLPTHPSIISFNVQVLGVTVTSSTSTKTVTPSVAPIDLMRLQSDSAFLGTLTNVPSETISSLTVALSAEQLTFLNDTGVALTSPTCPVNAICTFTPTAIGSVLINNVNQSFSSNAGIGIDFNLANAVTITGTTLNVNFSPTANNVLTVFALPRTGSNLASGQLDLIEDVTGLVTVSGQNATISNPLTGATLTAAATSTTNFDTDPTGALCPTTPGQTIANCIANNKVASMDVVVHSDGTLTIQEIEPLLATQQDLVEGTVVAINSGNSTQFTLVVNDILPAAQNSLVGTGLLHVGDSLTVNLSNAPTFLVDTKGLNVLATDLGNFTGGANTAVLRLGQRVAAHVTSFTPVNGNTLASCNSDIVTLRWSRFTTSVSSALNSNTFDITGFPSYFNASGAPTVQAFAGTPGADGITNFDGVTDASGLSTAKPVALRALFLENATNTSLFPFYAAKVRQH